MLHPNDAYHFSFFIVADDERQTYMTTKSTSTRALPHSVVREEVFQSVLTLYSSYLQSIVCEYPFHVQFEGERAIDLGGVSRDMFTAFFEEAYKKLFDGCTLLTPAVHPGIDLSSLSVFGAITSHAYLATGVLPVRIAFPTLAHCLLGATVDIPESIMLKSFIQSLSAHDAAVLNIALSTGVTESVVGIFSRFGFRELPTPETLKSSVLQIANCEFILKPSAAINKINLGIPPQHLSFWQKVSVRGLFSIYMAKCVTAEKVLDMFQDAEGGDPNQE